MSRRLPSRARGATAAAALLCAVLWTGRARAEADVFGLGTGRNGALSLTANGTVNAYAPIVKDVAAGATTVTVDPTLLRGASGALAKDELVMLWHSVGWTAAVTVGDQAPIDLSATGAVATGPAGLWELARLASVGPGASPNEQTLGLTAPTVNGYAAGQAQVVRVPEYTTVSLADAVYLTPAVFDGRSGGMVALLATGTVTLATNASILNAGVAGLPGGALVNNPTYPATCPGANGDPAGGYASKGASFDSRAALGASELGGRGNRLSGAGGGNCVNSGGGGGGGASAAKGGQGGDGWTGGAVGGLGGAGIYGDPRARLLMGGGGGAGQENDGVGSAGQPGGGVIFLRASALAGAGRFWAHGGDAAAAKNDGAGGGGGGGTIALFFAGAADCYRINARGGNGGAADDGHGPGGGGGGGTVFLVAASTTCERYATAGAAASNASRASTAGQAGALTVPGGAYCGVAVPPCPAATPICGAGGVCRTCAASAECPSDAPVCDAGACRKCDADADCPGGACDSGTGRCVECTAGNDAACTAAGRHCLVADLKCVDCTEDLHCASSAAAPICDAGSRTCRGCASSAECAAMPGKACAAAGARLGQCVECTAAEDSACASPTPYCLTPDEDVCVGCLTDANCEPSVPVCDAATNACRTCQADGECASGHCGVDPAVAGTCVTCLVDADCGGADPRCHSPGGVCVGCLSGADCAGDPTRPVCKSNRCQACGADDECPAAAPACWPSGRCLQCSPSMLTACSAGQKCSALGACVDCLADTDCGSAASGVVCEAGSCRDGCRGQGGNGCPPPLVCDSDDAQPGACVTAPGPDAGVDAGFDASEPADASARRDAAGPGDASEEADAAEGEDAAGAQGDAARADASPSTADVGASPGPDGASGPAMGSYDLGGCGCSSGAGLGLGAMLAPLALGLRRRRR